jgi:hypothetical protein
MLYVRNPTNNGKIFEDLRTHEEKIKNGIRKAYYRMGKQCTKDARESILQGPKTGRIYYIKKGSRTYKHQASAPGEPPANLTGRLRKSIDFEVRSFRQLEFGANTPYAAALELGSPQRKLLPRPYLVRALDKNHKNFHNFLASEMEKSLGI